MNTRKSHESPDQPSSRKQKIAYSDGLGWSDEHQTWIAHGRVGKKTFTVNTGQRLRDDAEVWLKNYKQDLKNQQETGIVRGLTVEAGLDLWAAEAPSDPKIHRKPSADRVKNVRTAYRLWVNPFIGKKLFSRVTEQDLATVIRNYIDTPGPHGPHNQDGVRNFIISLNTPPHWLWKRKKISRLPELPLVPKAVKKKIVVIHPGLVLDLLARYDRLVAYDIYAMVYVRILAFNGIRTENARSLRKEQFNEDLTQFDTGITKNDNTYTLPIPKELRDLLVRIPEINKPGLLFPPASGNQKRTQGWCLKALKQAARDLGISERIAWHRLRATYATILIRAGADIFVLMEALGWETISVALLYVSTVTDDLVKAQDRGIDLMHEAQLVRHRNRINER